MVNKQAFTDTFQYFDKAVIIEIIDIFIHYYPTNFQNKGQTLVIV